MRAVGTRAGALDRHGHRAASTLGGALLGSAASAPPAPPKFERTAEAPPPTHRDIMGCRVPWDFAPRDLLRAADPDPSSQQGATPRILTWLVEVDDRPLVIDRAIVWVHHHTPRGGDSWELVHLYRHPLEKAAQWEVAMVYDVPYVGRSAYSSPPRRKEMEAFLSDTWWTFAPSDGFRLLDADVCSRTWTESIGSPPTRRFPR